MSDYIADSMALVLRLEKRKLPRKVRDIFERAEAEELVIIIPAMVLAEVAYLSEKKRIDTNLIAVCEYVLRHPSISIGALTLELVQTAFNIMDIPELHDRLIAAHAVEKSSIVLTNDPDIQASSSVHSLWK